MQISQGIDTGPFPVIRPNLRAGRQFSYPGAGNLRLVQGKQVLVRSYAVAVRSNAAVANVPATVFVRKPHCAADCLPNNGLLVPMLDTATPNVGGVTVPIAGTSAADPRNRVDDMASSWNFLIPAAWTTQDLDLFVTLNSGNYSPLPNRPAVPECQSVIVGECRDNNDLELHLSFVPAKTVWFDPVFVHPADVEPPDTDASDILRMLNQLYPMNVMLGPPRTLTASEDLNASDLLDEVQEHFGCPEGHWWSACGFIPSHFIVGLVPNGYAALAEAGGLSNIGNNTFWASRLDPFSVAHEMGHAIGFEHASCVHGEAKGGGCDDYYPIPHGGIGGYGFDFDSWSPILPGDTRSSHLLHAHDFMSYGCRSKEPSACTAEWVSTYMWDITIDNSYTDTVQYRICGDGLPFLCGVEHAPSPTAGGTALPVVSALVVQEIPAMLIAERINPDGTAILRPAYPGSAAGSAVVPSPVESIYSVAVRDARGNTIALRDVVLHRRDDGARDFAAIVPIPPGQTAAKIELILLGNVIASLAGQPGPAPAVTITSPAAGERWARSETRRISWSTITGGTVPLRALVEYSADGGATSIPLRRDVESNVLDVHVDELPASNNARIIVRVSDGVNGAVATAQRSL